MSFGTVMTLILCLCMFLPNTITASAFSSRTNAPSTSNAYYYSSNPFYKSGYGMPNCTCYAYGRAWEILGSQPKLSTGNAGKWYWYNKSNGIYSYGSTPKLGAIACWDKYDQNQGHVAVVEAINGSTVTISESHYKGVSFDTRTINSNSSNYLTSMRFLGYIYIGDFGPVPDVCNCNDSYAGIYEVTANGGLKIRSAHSTNSGEIGLMPKGAQCTVTKGDGNWAHVSYNGLSGYSSMQYLRLVKSANHSPVGYVDLVEGGEGSIHVRGWVYDPDLSSQSLEVHVYIGGNVRESSVITRQTGVMANQYREDVNATFGITGNHGFDQWIETTARGSQPVYIHVVDANDSNGNTSVNRDNKFCFTVNINEKQGHVMSESEAAGQTIPDGNYLIISELGRRVYLDIPGTKYPADEQEKLIATEGSILPNKDYDSWTVTYLNNGFYKITQNGQNIALDVPGASLNHKTKVQTYKDNETFAQQWSIKPTNHGYTIQSRANGYYLDVKNAIIGDNGYIQTHEANDSKAQSWCFIPYISNDRLIADGRYTIKSECGDVYLDAYGHANTGDYKNGTNIDVALSKNDSFNIAYAGDGLYTLIETYTGLAVEVDDEDKAAFMQNNKNVQLGEFTGDRRQLWKIVDESDGKYRFVSKLNGYSLDLQNASTTNGSNVAIHRYNTTNAQKWTLECAHNFSEWTTTTEATCTTDGEHIRKCSTCDKIETKVITATGHKYVDTVIEPTCTEQGYIKHVCSKCGDTYTDSEIPAKGHNHNKVETIPPTETTAGYDKHSCTVCGDFFIDNIVPPISVVEIPTVSYVPGDNSVKLTWTAVKNAEKYAICGYVNNRWQKLAEGNGSSYTVKNLKSGVDYQVAVIGMFDGQWNMDFSNAITVTPNVVTAPVYPKESVQYSPEFHKIKIDWTKVDGAIQYGIAVKLAGKWKVQAYTDAETTTFTTPKLKPGSSYEVVICAKVDGKWQAQDIASRAFTVTIK